MSAQRHPLTTIRALGVAALFATGSALIACDGNDAEDAADEAADAVEEATDAVGEATEEAADEVEDAADEAG